MNSENSDNESTPYEDVQEFVPGMDAFSRVGPGSNIMGHGDRATQNPLDRFQIQIDAISRNLNNWDGIDISDQMITKMIETSRKLNAVKHKHSAAYVLGFLASNGGIKIDKKGLNFVFKKALPHISDESVLKPDVIRYARLWLEIGNKS